MHDRAKNVLKDNGHISRYLKIEHKSIQIRLSGLCARKSAASAVHWSEWHPKHCLMTMKKRDLMVD